MKKLISALAGVILATTAMADRFTLSDGSVINGTLKSVTDGNAVIATDFAGDITVAADKLLKLTIDTGLDRRVIVSGIAEYYTPEEMVGKQICILANLQPRTIRGIESQGMILMAKQLDGKMRFITPAETLSNGATIG